MPTETPDTNVSFPLTYSQTKFTDSRLFQYTLFSNHSNFAVLPQLSPHGYFAVLYVLNANFLKFYPYVCLSSP